MRSKIVACSENLEFEHIKLSSPTKYLFPISPSPVLSFIITLITSSEICKAKTPIVCSFCNIGLATKIAGASDGS